MQTLLFIVFLDLVGFGMIIPVLPFFAERLGVHPSWIIFLFGLYSLGQFLGAPLWGALSDRVGRRPVLLGTLAANAVANLFLAIVTSGAQLGFARFVAGLAAGNISTAYAYVTDFTDDKSRPRALGMLGAAFGLGFIIGPAIGGLLAGSGAGTGGLGRVARFAALMSALAFIATALFLQETHGSERREHARRHPRPTRWRLAARPVLRDLLLSTLFVVAGVAMLQSTYTIWGATELGLRPRDLGIILGITGVLSVGVQATLIGPLTRRYGAAHLTRFGAYCGTICMVIMPFSHSAYESVVPLCFFAVGGALFVPSISHLVSQTAGVNERGAVLGVFQSASSLGRVLGPFSASLIASSLGLRWPFLAGAICTLGGGLLVRIAMHESPVLENVETVKIVDAGNTVDSVGTVGNIEPVAAVES